jgi:C-terminal processing protease CtpA/Prc
VDRGDLVLIADSQGVRDIYTADGTALEPNAPLTVLVNKGTASASEVCVWQGGGGLRGWIRRRARPKDHMHAICCPQRVLVPPGGAPAAGGQVLAGALLDNKRAAIAGSENTFGKGLIQTVVDLSDGSGMAVTVAR